MVSAKMKNGMLSALRQVLPDEPGVAVIHSSLSKLAPPPDFDAFSAAFALDQLVRDGWTIALPAFTFSFCGGKDFVAASSKSEVGSLADFAIRNLPYAQRTRHPIYSFVVIGPRASEIMACQGETTFGADTSFAFFEMADATVVMMGCGWSYCTLFHRYEELAKVPYRYFKRFDGQADFGDGLHDTHAEMFVRDFDLDPDNDFSPAVRALREGQGIVSVPLWSGEVESLRSSNLAAICTAQLADNPFAYLKNSPTVSARLNNRVAAQASGPLRVAILGHSNVEMLKSAVHEHLSRNIGDRLIETYSVPFGQLEQNLLYTASELAQFAPDYLFFVDRLEDLTGTTTVGPKDRKLLEAKAGQYADTVRAYHAKAKGRIFIARFAALKPSLHSAAAMIALVDELNAILSDRLADLEGVAWIDIASQAASSGAEACEDRLWHLGRFPFSQPFTDRLAAHLTGFVLAALGKTSRLLVLDLDNTLWGGVLGEDGLDGIRIGGDYPGSAFSAFQREIKSLSQRGIALAVVSKNDSDLALHAIDEHPAMEIRSDDLVAHRINWQPKSQNIQEICDEMSLGLASVLFIDDNPVEREAVRRNLPEVKILDLPADPSGYVQALSNSQWLSVIDVTSEDLKRGQSYKHRAKIESQRASAVNLEDFYASLGMKLYLQPLDDGNIVRAAQLCAKTNQFNTTTKRYGAPDLKDMVSSGADVIVVGLSDNSSEHENIGLLVLIEKDGINGGVVDLFLLSCRVLGRGLEQAILGWALKRAGERGWTSLEGPIVETERNTPVRTVFRDAGFDQIADGLWVSQPESAKDLPKWIKIVDQISIEAEI